MVWTYYEDKYGKSKCIEGREDHSGYFRYHITIQNEKLLNLLGIENRNLYFQFYNILSFEEIDEEFGLHWLQTNDSKLSLHGKIHVCGTRKYEESVLTLYKLFIKKLTIDWGFLVGLDYSFKELGYIRLKPRIDFDENFWLIKNSRNPNNKYLNMDSTEFDNILNDLK